MQNVEIITLLLFVITFLALLSYRFRFPFPVVLVTAGLAISLIPGLPVIALQPNVVFLIFLPPLLYAAAWNISWRDFKANIRPIIMAAIGLVFFTTTCIGVLVHWLVPGVGWPVAFLLGAIISPPDAVAAAAITKGLGLHPRIVAILEGESLLNDASALIAFKYALAAVLAGSFSLGDASLDFLKVFGGGILTGLVVAYPLYLVHKMLVNDSVIDVTLTFLAPFASYLLAERFHFSGVLAVVVTGLYLSFRSAEIFTNESRIQGYAVWDVVVFILNALVFILMGLQLRPIVQHFEPGEVGRLVLYGTIIGLAALIIRLVWVIPAAILPRVLSKRIREREAFDKRNIAVFGFAGIRGIVSMAAALSLPLSLSTGEPFPFRAECIFLTFVFIVFTLLAQGLPMPWLLKLLKLPKHSILSEEYDVREGILKKVQEYIEKDCTGVAAEAKEMLLSNYKVRYHLLQQSHLPKIKKGQKLSAATQIFNQFAEAQLELLGLERTLTNDMRKKGHAAEEVLRKLEREIDLEEARLRLELYVE